MDQTNVRIPERENAFVEMAVLLLKQDGKDYTKKSFFAEAGMEKIERLGLMDRVAKALGHKPGSTHKTTRTQ